MTVNYKGREFYHYLGMQVDTRKTNLIEVLEPEGDRLITQHRAIIKLAEMLRENNVRLAVRKWNSIDDYFKDKETPYGSDKKMPEKIIFHSTNEWMERIGNRMSDSVILYSNSYSLPKEDNEE